MVGKTMPLVSVVIPVFNGANYLPEAIESVLKQTYVNWELLVVDDGSTDETWEIIRSYGSVVRGIRKENGGVASALNCGLQAATGVFIAWLSHDDLFLPEKLERQVQFLQEHEQFRACYTDYYIIDAQGSTITEIESPYYPRIEAIKKLFAGVYINGSSMMVKRSCFEIVGLFNDRLRYTQDAEMWLRILNRFEIGRVPEKLLKYRIHRAQGSRNVEVHKAETVLMFRQVLDQLGLVTIFPELAPSAHEPQIKAWAHLWLADTVGINRGWYDFADEEYARAIAIYPSWLNSARLKRVLNRIRWSVSPHYHALRSGLGRVLRKMKINHDHQLTKSDADKAIHGV